MSSIIDELTDDLDKMITTFGTVTGVNPAATETGLFDENELTEIQQEL